MRRTTGLKVHVGFQEELAENLRDSRIRIHILVGGEHLSIPGRCVSQDSATGIELQLVPDALPAKHRALYYSLYE